MIPLLVTCLGKVARVPAAVAWPGCSVPRQHLGRGAVPGRDAAPAGGTASVLGHRPATWVPALGTWLWGWCVCDAALEGCRYLCGCFLRKVGAHTASSPDQRCPEGGLASVKMCTGPALTSDEVADLGAPALKDCGCLWVFLVLLSCQAGTRAHTRALGGWRNAVSVLPESSWCCCSLRVEGKLCFLL